jgi:hypothetical protein
MPLLGLNLRTRPRPALLLTALMSVHSVGFVNTAFAGDSPEPAASLGAVELSSCDITGVAQPIVEGILSDARETDSDLSLGLFFSITCNEDVAFLREESVTPETQGTFLGDYRLRQQQAACKHWPKVSLPKDYRTPVRSSVPTLFASGDTDGGTPLWFTERVAQGFSDRVQVVLRGQGHTEWNDCVAQIYQQFVRGGEARGFGRAACPPAPRPPFKTS